MTDYWISGPKYWCEDCRKFISDNKASRKHHESGATHQENRRKRISEMKNKQKEKLKEDNEMDREIQRLRREAHKQIYDDLANQVPIASKEYEMLKQETPASNTRNVFDYPAPLPLYKSNTPLTPNPGTIPPVNWSYFDDEMIDAQRRRLYGRKYESLKEEQEEVLASLTAPPQPVKKPDPVEKPVNRYNSGIPGEYKVVDPNQYYNEYYSLASEEQQGQEGTDYDQYNQDYYNYYQNYYYNAEQYSAENPGTDPSIAGSYSAENYEPPASGTSEPDNSHHVSSKSKRENSEEEDEFVPKEIDTTQEKLPEKSLNQLLQEEGKTVSISFKKPAFTNKKPRRK